MAKAKAKVMSAAKIDDVVAAMAAAGAAEVQEEVFQEALASEMAQEAEAAQEAAQVAKAEVKEKKVAAKKVAAKSVAKSVAKKVVKSVKAKAGEGVSKNGYKIVVANFREKGLLSFGRWYALLKAVGAKNKKKVPAQDKVVEAYKKGKSPKEVLGLA